MIINDNCGCDCLERLHLNMFKLAQIFWGVLSKLQQMASKRNALRFRKSSDDDNHEQF